MHLSKQQRYQLLKDSLRDATDAPLYTYRLENNYIPVLGEGNLNTTVMLIGEAPGKNEGETGKPFIGAAGKILTQLLKEIQLGRNDVFITSIVHDRPPQKNRKPTKQEIVYYFRFLKSLLEIIQPNIIVTMGNTATEQLFSQLNLTEKIQPILAIHGIPIATHLNKIPITILPTLHPASVLYQRKNLPLIQKDFQVLLGLLQSKHV